MRFLTATFSKNFFFSVLTKRESSPLCFLLCVIAGLDGILKAEAVVLFAKVLQKYGIETFEDLHVNGLSEEAESELKQIPGQRSGLSLQYFYMLAGDDTLAKPDRHILHFIHQHTGKLPTMREAQELMTQTVAKLKKQYPNLNVRLLDYTIWDYMAHSAGKEM